MFIYPYHRKHAIPSGQPDWKSRRLMASCW